MTELSDIMALVVNAFNGAPAIDEMTRHGNYNAWAQKLVGLAHSQPSAELRTLLSAVASDGLEHVHELLLEFGRSKIDSLEVETLIEVSKLAEDNSENANCACLVLSYIATQLWILKSAGRLYDEVDKAPFPGWGIVPHALALIALRNGSVDGASELVAHSYDVLMMYYPNPQLVGLVYALKRYHALSNLIHESREIAISNLVDDLRTGCQSSTSTRSAVAALCWSVGLVAESYALGSLSDHARIPGRRFFRNLVRRSLYCSRHDTLVRYVWLELIDQNCLSDFNSHRKLLNILFKMGVSWVPDRTFAVPPSRLYARCLISWFRRETTRYSLRQYQEVVQELLRIRQLENQVIRVRVLGLNGLMTAQLGHAVALTSKKEYVDAILAASESIIRVVEQKTIYPEWPEYFDRPNLPVIELIESKLAAATASSSRIDEANFIIDFIEQFRCAALEYWLRIVPTYPPSNLDPQLKALLEREEQLLREMRSAYFVLLHNLLPRHYRRFNLFTTSAEAIEEAFGEFANNPGSLGVEIPMHNVVLPQELGRATYKRITEELEALYAKMEQWDLRLASRRRFPAATNQDLVNLLRSHNATA